jgi:DNA-binding NarL/FixJ family response regulator
VSGSIKVVLADDHEVFVEGLRMVLAAEDDLEIVATAGDGAGALRAAEEHQPDVLVLDVHMPATDIQQVITAARQRVPGTRLLALSADTRPETVTALLQAGADGFVPKDASSRQVATAIRKLVKGQEEAFAAFAFPPVRVQPKDREIDLLVSSLSPREQQILALLAAGWNNRRIAESCYLSVNTVRTHVQNVLVKLGVHSKLEAAAFAVRHGVVPPGGTVPASRAVSG